MSSEIRLLSLVDFEDVSLLAALKSRIFSNQLLQTLLIHSLSRERISEKLEVHILLVEPEN